MSREDRDHWESKHAPATAGEPAPFLVEHALLLPVGRTLDLASGRGGNARFLAGLGHRVVAVDIARAALSFVRHASPATLAVQMDLDEAAFRPGSFDAIVCVSFLDRRLFPAIERWLRPGGVLFFDTFLVDQAALGHPNNPAYLLERGELRRTLGERYRILVEREGERRDGSARSYRAGIVASLRDLPHALLRD